MDVVYRRCCGLDVHKLTVVACLLLMDDKGNKKQKRREFGTFSDDLQKLMLWLFSNKVTHVAMESTGVYFEAGLECAGGQLRRAAGQSATHEGVARP